MKTLTFTLLFALFATSAFATQNKCSVKLRLQSTTTSYLDEATIFFDEEINPAYDGAEDAEKVFNTVPGMPAIYSFTNDLTKCSINGYGTLNNTQVVELGFKVSVSGMYKITASSVNNFDGTSIIRLEDRKMHTFTDLRANFYIIDLYTTDAASGRFYLHVSAPAQFSSTNAGCDNNDGIINLQFDNSVTWDIIELSDASNTPVNTYANVNNSALSFSGLPEGDYNLTFLYGSYSSTRVFHVAGNHVVASIGTPSETIFKGEEVVFNADAKHATHYTWEFGDGTIITGIANPSMSFLQAGTFDVKLVASNDYGCSATAQSSVSVATTTGINELPGKSICVFGNGRNITINLNEVVNNNAEVTVYNLLGAPVYSQPFSAQKQVVTISDQPNGYYIVSVKNAGKLNTTRVFLSR